MTIRKQLSRLALLTAIALSSSTSVLAESFQVIDLQLDGEGLSALNIDAGAGNLIVNGDKDVDDILVTARLHGLEDSDDYVLTLEKRGSKGELVAKTRGQNYAGKGTWIDLSVTVPDSLFVDIRDGSGEIRVRALNNGLEVQDGSGDLRIDTISGVVRVDDGSGYLEINTINGDLRVDDNSGGIRIRTVNGDLTIDDGSGGIDVDTVSGDVNIDDGSGDILIENVRGGVIIDDNSGDIEVDGAQTFELVDDGSGSVDLRNIRAESRR